MSEKNLSASAGALTEAGTLLQAGRRSDAIVVLRNAVQSGADDAEIQGNLGALLFQERKQREGLFFLERASACANVAIDHVINYGYCLKHVGRRSEALGVFDRAMLRAPGHARLHWHRALLRLLLQQDIPLALDDYEWRWQVEDFPDKPRWSSIARWDGSTDRAITLLVHAEQGYGDTIHFLRYLPLAARRVGRLIFEVQAPLYRLMCHQQSAGMAVLPANVQILARGQKMPGANVQIPLLSLPRALAAFDFSDPPCRSAYLAAPGSVAGSQPMSGSPRNTVGIAWAGRPSHPHDNLRSFPVECFAPLLQIPGLRWVSLQVGPAAQAINEDRFKDANMLDVSPMLEDFFDTAQVIRGLSLVIAPDTAVAHLAAALGVRTWIPIASAPDWRWGTEASTTPWYDMVTLFRQHSPESWTGVFEAIGRSLVHL